MLEITPDLQVSQSEIQYDFLRASGPGGQNVNKVSSAVQLRFDVRNSPSLPDEVKARLARLAGNRLTEDGILIIEGRRYRQQERNRQDVLDRFIRLIQKAAARPKIRKPTRPSMAAKAARVAEKKRRAAIKRSRRASLEGDE